jgi:hypothetical protein
VPQLDSLLAEAGFAWRHLEVEALRATLEIEGAHGPGARLVGRLPDALIAGMRRVIPTLICRIERQPA